MTQDLHSLLMRQLRRILPNNEAPPESWAPLLQAVDEVYREFDIDHAMLMRSLELSSAELMKANSEMRGMLQALPDLFLRLRSDGTIIDRRGNVGSELVAWGYEIGDRIQDVSVEGLGPRLEAALREVRITRSIASLELVLPRGEQKACCEARLVPLPDGEVLVLIRDISERYLAERQREETFTLLNSLIDNVNAGVLIETTERRAFSANACFCEIFGIRTPPREIVKLDELTELLQFASPAPEEFTSRIDQIVIEGQPVVAESLELSGQRYFERDYAPIFVSDGQLIGHMWQYRNVTERRNLQSQLEHSQKMEALGRLAGGVAHDFNNLLTSIIGHSELVLEEVSDPDPRADLGEILRSAYRAADLTRQLLAFGRKQVLQPSVLDLNENVTALTSMLHRLIPATIEVSTHLEESLGLINADPGQIEQVIVNLAVNARDAISGGGRLELETANVTLEVPKTGVPSAIPPGVYVRLRIRDSGCGIDDETLHHIFEPFFTTKEAGKGTGLGLSTVYGIVRQAGGYLQVRSELGEGSAFDVVFPALASTHRNQAEPHVEVKRCSRSLGSSTVLLLEDEAAVRQLLAQVLRGAGLVVLEAESGLRAVEVAAEYQGQLDLLISDVVLPSLSGPEAAEQIRRQRPALKALFISGYPNHKLIAEHGHFGADKVLLKPFSSVVFLDRVGEALGVRQAPSISVASPPAVCAEQAV